jgi:hypothetical protein
VPAHPSDLHSSEWDATAYHRLSDPQFSWGQKVLTRLKLQGDQAERVAEEGDAARAPQRPERPVVPQQPLRTHPAPAGPGFCTLLVQLLLHALRGIDTISWLARGGFWSGCPYGGLHG